MKNSIKTLVAVFSFFMIAAHGMAFAAGGSLANQGTVSDTATVSMNIGLFAAIQGLDNFSLSTTDADGSENAVYSGSDAFTVKSNGSIRVTLTGADLVNGANVITPIYSLDSSGLTFDTGVGVHNSGHTVSASATLGDISDQEAGAYSGEITITVSAL